MQVIAGQHFFPQNFVQRSEQLIGIAHPVGKVFIRDIYFPQAEALLLAV